MLSGKGRYLDPADPETYDHYNIQYALAKDFLDDNFCILGGQTLDIGCGTGKVSAYLAQIIDSPVVAIDISAARVEFAKRHHREDNLIYMRGEAGHFCKNKKIPAASFDTVLSLNTVPQLPGYLRKSYLVDLKRLLKPDGIAIFLNTHCEKLEKAIQKVMTDKVWVNLFQGFDLEAANTPTDKLQTLGMRAGFYDCDVSKTQAHKKFASATELKKYLLGSLVHVAYLRTKIANTHDARNTIEIFINHIVVELQNLLGGKLNGKLNLKFVQNSAVMFSTHAALDKIARRIEYSEYVTPEILSLRAKL